jgi:hypothetical protein
MNDGRSMRAVKSIEGPHFWEGKGERGRNESTLVLAERARRNCARSMRAVEDNLGHSFDEKR